MKRIDNKVFISLAVSVFFHTALLSSSGHILIKGVSSFVERTTKMFDIKIVEKEAPAFLHELLTMKIPEQGCGRLFLPVLETEDKREAMEERAAEVSGWYGQLCQFAAAKRVEALEAGEILNLLAKATTDPRLPRNAAGLASRIVNLEKRLKRDGYDLSYTDSEPKKYTIKPTG